MALPERLRAPGVMAAWLEAVGKDVALTGERNPGFHTILEVIGALGLKLPAEASGCVNYQGEVWYRKHFTPLPEWRGNKDHSSPHF